MDLSFSLPVTPGGVLAAVACVVAGAPLFACGLRAYRMRTSFGELTERPLSADATGLVRARGRVALDGPLFAPLSGTPCAGFQLEVRGQGSSVGGVVRDWRAFRLESGGTSAYVPAEHAEWHAPVTAQRDLAAGVEVPERLSALLDSCNEVRWLRQRGVALHVVERALESGRVVSVVGVLHNSRVATEEYIEQLAATGTDGPFTAPRMLPGPEYGDHEMQLDPDDALENVLVFADPPEAPMPRLSRWNEALLAVGPMLSIAGLLYLGRAAEPLLTRRP